MTQDELKMVLEFVESINLGSRSASVEQQRQVVAVIKEALAQPEQAPVALEAVYETIIQWDEGGGKRSRRELARRIVALYTTPPQRTWVGWGDEEKE